jgi:hypothetical protein
MTTAELGKIFVERGIKLNELPESGFDSLIGEGTGGAVLFGTTGGVMEAALRTVYEVVSCFAWGVCCAAVPWAAPGPPSNQHTRQPSNPPTRQLPGDWRADGAHRV